ncbi:DUF2946 domain-containing protein [Noviherbaspirillum soli]|uniref:DUF2946 domain-containing protein n=1 Tax=Noviherbaspirillum soli TaxID=1064518 RepID=UPI00188B8EE8|nr:DUF2946 domain-containing protein [Noviherbaspirillum soli]
MAAWLAMFAVVIASVAPTISHALAQSAQLSHAQIQIADEGAPEDLCSTDADADADHAHAGGHGPAPSPALHLEHCPFCHLHADALQVPVVALPILPIATRPSRPLLFFLAPSLLHAWRSAQPRAPPAVC